MATITAFFGGIVAGLGIAAFLLGLFCLAANSKQADECAEREMAEWERQRKAKEA